MIGSPKTVPTGRSYASPGWSNMSATNVAQPWGTGWPIADSR